MKRVTVHLPLSTSEGGPFEAKPVPDGLNWDYWLGQAPKVDYCPERCHYQFRWWYEYSGGVMTDWGAHHMDVAYWALDLENSGPLTIDGTRTKLPNIANGYNTPKHPIVQYTLPGDVVLDVVADYEGVMFEGESGTIFVNRGRITGKPIEQQNADNGLKEKTMAAVTELFKGNTAKMGDHMGNFFEAFKLGKHPISDVAGQHRAVSACHLGNISIRLARKLTWDAAKEDFVGDSEASAMLKREPREPYGFKPVA
jgi:predicted dehydrogenase